MGLGRPLPQTQVCKEYPFRCVCLQDIGDNLWWGKDYKVEFLVIGDIVSAEEFF